ncbi:MAG: DUF2809 domain-containing protein [Chthoniobacteraceae bacterium]
MAPALFVVALGLIWRSHIFPLSPFAKKYGADALWALLVFLLIRLIQSRARIWASAGIAFGISVAVELSQLYHAAWIDTMRATWLGSLILGSVFNWPDIPAYALGIIVGILIDLRLPR